MEERIELIVQYVGDLGRVQEEVGFSAVVLLGGYAVLALEPEKLARLSEYPEIVYMETPRRLFFEVNDGKAGACINEVQAPAFFGAQGGGLTGQGVLVAVIDSGIDYFHPDFRTEDGGSRIALLWDQTVREGEQGLGTAYRGDPALGYVYTKAEIDEALSAGDQQEALRLVPESDISGHGTHVAGIAAGNGRASGGRYRGVAYESDLIVVKLGRSVGDSYPQTAGLMAAVDFALREGIRRNRPVVANISFGNNDGAHNGRSILESYMDTAAGIWQNSIVIGTGNEGTLGRHRGGYLDAAEEVELAVGEAEGTVEFWLWKNYFDHFTVTVVAPDGSEAGPFITHAQEARQVYAQEFLLRQNRVRLFYQGPTPYNPLAQVQVTLLAGRGGEGIGGGGRGSLGGIWRIRLRPEQIVTGEYDIWLNAALGSPETHFLEPTQFRSLTIPSTAGLPISVGAFDSRTGAVAYFSGQGYPRGGIPAAGNLAGGFDGGAGKERAGREVKPDLVAPGVDIMSAAPGGGYAVRSGTSMATPFVAGAAALLMEWGIVRGNDRSLYGQRLKAHLLDGARRREGVDYPLPGEGWGALCLRDSLPL